MPDRPRSAGACPCVRRVLVAGPAGVSGSPAPRFRRVSVPLRSRGPARVFRSVARPTRVFRPGVGPRVFCPGVGPRVFCPGVGPRVFRPGVKPRRGRVSSTSGSNSSRAG
ncbi:hypothetical protein GCM10027075_25800 [Streptomyces heilongjiangensis]